MIAWAIQEYFKISLFMKVDTIKGSSYVMTCTKACTVHAVLSSSQNSLLVLEAGKAGQYGFVAPTEVVEISDEDALVTQTFKGTAPRLSAQEGLHHGEDGILKNIMAESGTFAGTVTANGGVRVPLPSTAQEAMSWDAILEEQARRDWLLARSASYAAVPSWVSLLVRTQSISNYKYSTSNASLKEGVIENDFYDHVVRMTPASGISLLGVSTKPWKFAHLLGTYKDPAFAAAAAWHITGADNASVMLGSTTHGYGCTTNASAPCYSHPIHWCNYDHAGAHQDYRFPLLNAVNNYSGFDMAPAWQATLYGKSYLGSTASCLIRGTDYGRANGDARYVWALVPSVTFLAVAMAPRKAADHAPVENRWELFVDEQYVMPMTAHFCGGGHTAVLSATVKAHEVGSVQETGLRMAGMRVDTGSLPGRTAAREILGRVVMDGATVKPVPEVEASVLEVPAEGGEVTLTASSALSEALYVLNDTMCGHDAAAVWCTQSAEEIPAGGGQVILTLAPNTTGKARQVWAFVGHHYAQAAVVEINQLS